MRFTPEEEVRLDAVNQAMRAQFFEQLAAHSSSGAAQVEAAVVPPRVLFVRSDFDAVLGDDHDELAERFRKAAHVVAMCNATASWDATAVYGSRPGQPACWRIVLG